MKIGQFSITTKRRVCPKCGGGRISTDDFEGIRRRTFYCGDCGAFEGFTLFLFPFLRNSFFNLRLGWF